MISHPTQKQGEALAAYVRMLAEGLSLGQVTTRYLPEHCVVRLSWPHPNAPTVEQGIEFAPSRDEVGRIRHFLRVYARSKQFAARRAGAAR